MSPKQINVALKNIFNDYGLDINGVKIKSDSPCDVNVTHEKNRTTIKFLKNLPKAEIKRFITLSAYIEGIYFGEEKGSIKLKNFPDLFFGYEETTSLVSLIQNNFYSSIDIHKEVEEKYTCKDQERIAKKCLQYAQEWTTISMNGGVDFKTAGYLKRYDLRRKCYNFVKENIKSDFAKEEEHSSILLTFLFFSVILPAIISWVVHRVLDELFTK
jgi:hypothetical protein